MIDNLPLWLVSASLLLNALFLSRLLRKIDAVYDEVIGRPGYRGLSDRVRGIEEHAGLVDVFDGVTDRRANVERRQAKA